MWGPTRPAHCDVLMLVLRAVWTLQVSTLDLSFRKLYATQLSAEKRPAPTADLGAFALSIEMYTTGGVSHTWSGKVIAAELRHRPDPYRVSPLLRPVGPAGDVLDSRLRLAVSSVLPSGLVTVVLYDGPADRHALLRDVNGRLGHGETTIAFERAFLGGFTIQPVVFEPRRALDATAETPSGLWASLRFFDGGDEGQVINDVDVIEKLLHGLLSAAMMQRVPAGATDSTRISHALVQGDW